MSYIEIKDLKINKYVINITLENMTSYGVFSLDKEISRHFMMIIAGINTNNSSCKYKEKDIFDNDEFFKDRILLDFQKGYLKTLNPLNIKDAFEERFNISFDQVAFKNAIALLNVRNEILVTNEYRFTDYGVTLSGLAILKSITIKNILVLNPVKMVRNDYNKKKIIDEITNLNKYNNIIIDVDSFFDYKDKISKFIVFTEYDEVYEIDPNKDTLLVLDDNMNAKYRLFKNGLIVVCLNKYTKDELKMMTKNKIKFKVINFYSLPEYVSSIPKANKVEVKKKKKKLWERLWLK